MVAPIAMMKPYVGRANTKPDSRTPRRLTSTSTTSTPRLSSTACVESSGTADVTASTPEAIETAAVST